MEASRILQGQNLTEQEVPQQCFGRADTEPIPPEVASVTTEENLNHQTAVRKCFICQASFSLQSELSDHLSSEHGQQPVVKFGCKPCGVEFSSF
ncbi:Zinc finger protein-likeOZF [Orchesella cincta]|uniref:Zinc finger protein-likeOZF n=1 Tax=Orchesella cincta TaxID=48709 RepID=A0A1D2M0X6_ORCCI|nr:Zinc finger protein-likeOZF [Orchesella cincta]